MIQIKNKVRLLSRAFLLSMALVLTACSGAGSDGSEMPYNLGNDQQSGDTSPYSGDHIHWIKIDVPNSTTIQSLSMFARRYLGSTAANVRMSVYTDTSGYADDLVVGSEVQTTLTGDLQLLTFDVPATPIAAGTYWVGFNADVDISVSSDLSLSAKDVCFVTSVDPTSVVWPADVSPSRSSHQQNNLDVYLTVLD